jgi:hypothetical protein
MRIEVGELAPIVFGLLGVLRRGIFGLYWWDPHFIATT